jgi:pSer/pThr/pTyr-binding forkhead associated (FHA) protein
MKNLKKFLAVFALGASTIIGCDSEPPVDETPGPDGAALVQQIKENREDKTQVFDVDLGSTTGVTIEGEEGSLFTFYYGNIADLDGNLVGGVIQVELIEIYEKSDMVLLNRSTMGLLPDGNHAST